ncbi:MAG: GntR family transcriptional regulator [Pseudomonadota bacterium]
MAAKNPKTECLNDLRLRVLTLQLDPGSAVDETALAVEYGLSRTPMREILQRLAGEGYVTQQENRGTQVASMDFAVIRQFFQTAPVVYANIGAQAAENRTAAQLDAVKAVQAKFKRAEASDAALLNNQFHALIGEMAANPYLMVSLTRLLIDHTRLSQTFYRPTSESERGLVSKASEHHDAMIAALEAREPAVMIDLTLQHWDLSKDRMEKYVRPDPLPIDVISLKDRARAV